jgi:hypothetical protein
MSNSAFTPTVLQEFREASVSQSGIVTTGTQSFGGAKTFEGAFTAGSSTPANIEHLIQGGPSSQNVLTLDNNNASPTFTQIRFKMGGVSRGYVGASATNSFQVVNGAGTQFNGQCADGGGWTLGQNGSTAINLTVNGNLRSNGKHSGSGISIPSGTSAATTFLSETDVLVGTSSTFLLVVTLRSQNTPDRGAVGLFAISTHSGGTAAVVLISSTITNGGSTFVSGTPGSGQVGISALNDSGTWRLRHEGNSLGDGYGLGYEMVGGST